MIRGIVSLGFAVLIVAGMPVATADDVIVNGTEVTAKTADGVTTAAVTLLNVGEKQVDLAAPVVSQPSCVVSVKPTSLPPGQSTSVTLTLQKGCPAAATVAVDLDGPRGPIPVVTVKPAEPTKSSFSPLVTGLDFAAVAALITLIVGFIAFGVARSGAAKPTNDVKQQREAKYTLLTSVVGERVFSLSGSEVVWKPVPPLSYKQSSTVANLKAGWSFEDSWVTSLTAGTSAVIAFASSSDLFTALLGEEPEAALRIPAVAALTSAALIAVAVLVVKVLGSDADEVTVTGLVLSTALVVAAAVTNVITAAVAADGLIESAVWGQAVALAGFAVAALLVIYGGRSLWHLVVGGVEEPVPELPDDVTEAWSDEPQWNVPIVLARLRHDYAEFMTDDPNAAPTPTLTPEQVWLMPVGTTGPRRERVRSLL